MMVDTSHRTMTIRGRPLLTIKISKDTTVDEISTQLAKIIDSPQFLDMLIDTQECIIDMYGAVNRALFSKEVSR